MVIAERLGQLTSGALQFFPLFFALVEMVPEIQALTATDLSKVCKIIGNRLGGDRSAILAMLDQYNRVGLAQVLVGNQNPKDVLWQISTALIGYSLEEIMGAYADRLERLEGGGE